MEPERLGALAPILQKHPEWFIPANNGFYYPDLQNKKACDYIFTEISKLVEKYKLAWIKIDFNFDRGTDSSCTEFSLYYEIWDRLLDKLRTKYPNVFFEGCSSGGMCLDINTLSHFDGYFLSDTVNSVDVLRIYQGALLRLSPGRLGKWVVLRSIGKTIPVYGTPADSSPDRLVTPAGATWEISITANVDFAARVCLPGMFGLSGDISGLPEETLNRLHHHINFFKKWRTFIIGSIAHLLTPPCLKENRSGWAAIQLQHPENKTNLLFVYRLDNAENKKSFRLRKLDIKKQYKVVNDANANVKPQLFTGDVLMNNGFAVNIANRNSAAVFIISPV